MQRNDLCLQGFEWYLKANGRFWENMRAIAPSFRSLGIDILWLPPAYKGMAGANDVGYGVYDLYDLGEFSQKGTVRTKYGTKDEYLSLIKTCHDNDIAVMADIVMNHRLGADAPEKSRGRKKKQENRMIPISEDRDIESWTRFTFPGRNGTYSTFVWDQSCFNGVDYDNMRQLKAIHLLDGRMWNMNVDKENGNFDYLMGCNVDVKNPRVAKELIRWGKWYCDTTGIDAFRMDAVKHIGFDFMEEWIKEMRRHTGREMFACGEYWHGDVARLDAYLSNAHRVMSLFDVSLHFKLFDVSQQGQRFDLRHVFDGTLVGRDPFHSVTFVDNHDTEPGQSLESFVKDWFKPMAYALILLRIDGLPCVFYGDLFGIPAKGIAPIEKLRTLMRLRYLCAYGTQHDYFESTSAGWTREGVQEYPESGLAVLFSTGGHVERRMYVSQRHAGKTFVDALGSGATVVIDANGCGVFHVGGGTIAAYALSDALEEIWLHA